VPPEQSVVSFQVDPLVDAHDDVEQRWKAWQQRGVERDERTRVIVLVVASIAALALAAWFSRGGTV